MSRYKVEQISHNWRDRYIVCHDENEPCPLIAVVNYVILSQDQNIKPVSGYVSEDDLLSFVETTLDIQLLKRFPDDAAQIAELKDKYMSVLPKFAEGISINPQVNSIIGFEKSVEVSLIEELGIPLMHGWIVNDEDSTTAAALGGRSLNELMDVLLLDKSTETTDSTSFTSRKEVGQDDQATYLIIKKFMENTKTQLSLHGLEEVIQLSCICDYMMEEEQPFAILFTNGHLHVLRVADATLHVLQTDLRVMASHPDAVWQILGNVDGDNYFVNADFIAINDEEDYEVSKLYAKNQSAHLKRKLERDMGLVDCAHLKRKLGHSKGLVDWDNTKEKLDHSKGLVDCDSIKEASEHEKELLEMLEKERLKQEKKSRKNAKKKQRKKAQRVNGTPGGNPIEQELDNTVSTQDGDQNTEAAPDSTLLQQELDTGLTQDGDPEQEENIEAAQDSTPADILHQQEKNIDAIPYCHKWVAERFFKFLAEFRCNGKSKKPYFEGEIEALKFRDLFELSIKYSDIYNDCQELAFVIRDHYDSYSEDLRCSLVKYLKEHHVEHKKAEVAVLEILGTPMSYEPFTDFAERNRSALVEFYEIYQTSVAKTTSKLGRRMPRQFMRCIIDTHKKGHCWNGEWKTSDMKVRSDGREFVITKVAEHNRSKEGMEADFKNLFEIIFPYYEHEEKNTDSGEMEKVLPCYFQKLKDDCTKVPDPKELGKLETFQRFLDSHPAVMPPMAVTDFLGHVYMTCDDLLVVHGTNVFSPLQELETRAVDWKGYVLGLSKPFKDVYWHFSADVYELGYWFLLKFIRNFIQHVRLDKKDDHDIIIRSLMIARYLAQFVADLILFILRSPDMNGLSFSSAWRKFAESDE